MYVHSSVKGLPFSTEMSFSFLEKAAGSEGHNQSRCSVHIRTRTLSEYESDETNVQLVQEKEPMVYFTLCEYHSYTLTTCQ